MKLSGEIWNHGMGQLPTATGRITPDNPYAYWSGKAEKLEAENEMLWEKIRDWSTIEIGGKKLAIDVEALLKGEKHVD